MRERINAMIEKATELIQNAAELGSINELKVQYLGKSGEVTNLLKGMKDVPNEQKPEIGKEVNKARDIITNMIEEKIKDLQKKALDAKMMKEQIDITYDEVDANRGSLHPCTFKEYKEQNEGWL